jgi:uncharacterized protein YoxC
MDILGKLREGAEFVASIPTDVVDAGYNIVNTVYYKATGHTLGKPLHSKVLVNNITTKLVNRKVFSDIPTDDELNDPNKAKHYFLKAVKKNNNELIEITLQHSFKNPKSAETVLKTAEDDLLNKIDALSSGKATAEDGIVVARELELLSQFTKDPNIAKMLPYVSKLNAKFHDENWLKKHPEYKGVKEAIDKYHTINKTLDMINLLSIATFGAGKLGVRVFKTPLIKAVSHAIATASAGTPIITGVYKASANQESLSQAVSPLDALMIGDVIRGGKEILKTKDAIATYEMYKQLQDPNFNPIEHLLSQLSKKYDLTNEELADFKLTIMRSENEEFKKSEVFAKALAKDKGDKHSFILDKIISRHNFENELLQNDNHIINAFLEHEPLKRYFMENHFKNGKIVIEDINKVEEDLSKMAKKDPVIANFMKYNRQKRLLGELVKAVEHGNTEVSISVMRPNTLGSETTPATEDKIIDLTQPLKSIIDEAEKEFSKNAILSITYKTKSGDTISRTIKPFYAPSNDEFRILKGKFQVLKDDKWEEIEDTFTIPMSRTHQLETTLKEIAREKGYADIKPVEGAVEYIKPATNIFPYKLVRLSDRLLKLENTLLKNNQKIKDKEVEEFRKLVEEAYESGYLPPVIKKKVGKQEVELTTPLDYYLQAKPQEVFKIIKNNIIQHTKDIISRNKETSGIFKEVIYDEGGSLLKLVENELKEYRDLVKGMKENVINTEKDVLSKTKTFAKDDASIEKELLQSVKSYVKDVGGNLKQIDNAVKNIKSKAKEYIKDGGDELAYRLNHEFGKIEELIKNVQTRSFKKLFKSLFNKSDLKDLKRGVKGYRQIGKDTLTDIANIEKELKSNYAEIKNSLTNILNLIKTEQGVSKLNKAELIKNIENDFKTLNESLQKLDTTDLYTSIKGYFETAKESFKDYTLQNEKIESKIKDLSDLAQALTSAERVSLRDNIKLTDLIDKSAMRIDAIADTIKKIATTPYQEMRREGGGFATTFDNYESFKAYASLKYLAPTFQHMKATSFMKSFVEELENLEKRNPHGLNPTQKVVKDFLNLYLHRNMSDFAKSQRILGNLITLLNPSVALGNFVAGLQSIHALFPSLDLMKIGEIKHVWNKEFKKMLYAEGLYKYNILNPFYVAIETILKSHVLANLKDDKIFNNVILDYAKHIGIKDEKILESVKAYYQDRREELADNIINFISGLDARALQVWSIEFAKYGESIMPWYRFIFTPLSVAVETIRQWKNAPEYITRLGVGKTFGKALAFTTFSAIALGSQAVPFMAPAETVYNVAKTLVNTLAVALGDDEVFTDKNFAELVLKELDYHILKTGLFDPNERVNFYTSFGSALLQAIAGAEAKGWDTNAFIHSLRVGLDFISKIGASGVISPTAGSYVADIPAPSLSIVQNIVRKSMFATDDQSKQTQTILALIQSFPLTNNLYKEIAGRTLVKGVGEKGKEEIWQPSLPQELLSKEGQGVLGLAHLVGFMLLHADAIFNGAEIQKATELFRYELASDEDKKKMFSPVKNPEGTDYYKLLNFKDYNVFRNKPEDIIATLKYIPENDIPKVKERADDLIIKNLNKMVKLVKEGKGTDKEIEEIKHRYEALQNYIVVADYLGWDKVSDDLTLDRVRELHRMAYKVLKEKGIDVDYKDILRAKRKLESEKIGSQ